MARDRPRTAHPARGRQQPQRQDEPQNVRVHSPREVIDESGMPHVVGSSSSRPWVPSNQALLMLFIIVRMLTPFGAIISDCDETYNYWEPTHFFLYGKGFQTWEYDPKYGLRSYLYILIHTVPLFLCDRLLAPHRMWVFFILRTIFGGICGLSEVYFVHGAIKEFGPNTGRITMGFLLFGAGMFVSSTAYLPSTTSMYLLMVSYGAWFCRDLKLAILTTAISALLSWPFTALLGLPIAIDIVFRRKRPAFFLRWCIISLVTVLGPQLMFDSMYYGKLTNAPLNIIWYNIFTGHGPDLYGTEPWSFYIVNGFLNFNITFFLALIALPCLFLVYFVLPQQAKSTSENSLLLPCWLGISGLYLWLAVFICQPHKEERFLFPVYPLLALAAAMAIDSIQKLIFFIFVRIKQRHYLWHTNWMSVSAIVIAALISISRVLALYIGYSAPMNAWIHISHLPQAEPEIYAESNLNGPIQICVGKEWHRFPSSFFLPSNQWRLHFLQSEFRGQLPQPFIENDPDHALSTKRDTFNDLNLEETNRYDIKPTDCHFIIDLESSTGKATELEPIYSLDKTNWTVEAEFPFLDAQVSPRLYRAFYIPYLSSQKCKYSKYVILKNLKKFPN